MEIPVLVRSVWDSHREETVVERGVYSVFRNSVAGAGQGAVERARRGMLSGALPGASCQPQLAQPANPNRL